MRGFRLQAIFGSISPFTGVASMVILAILLITTISLTVFDLPWIAFLSGIFFAAAIGLVGRLAYAETALGEVRENVRHIDDELPLMVVYVSADGKVRFHNQAFRLWLRARKETINGRSLRDAVGLTIFSQMKAGLDAALAGRMHEETWTHEGLGSPETRIHTQYLPGLGAEGAPTGAYIVQSDVSSLAYLAGNAQGTMPRVRTAATRPAGRPSSQAPEESASDSQAAPQPNGVENERRIFVNTMTEELTDWRNAGDRLRFALDNDEFRLYCQRIAPLTADAASRPLYEILLRLQEEEEGLMPPGAFLPLAEEYGLLPDLDRWVVTHLLDWSTAVPMRQQALYSINVSAPTIGDAVAFPDFVARELRRTGVKGSMLCFEITDEEAMSRPKDAARFIAMLSEAGCSTALCGFGQNASSYSLLKHLKVDYIKIDGDIVLGLTRNPLAVTKLKAIARVARSTSRHTIAEFVEDEATLAMLREHGVEYAQGFGVARPLPLAELP